MRSRDRKYYHSEVNVEDIKFKSVFVNSDKIDYYHDLVAKFNKATTIELKRKYGADLPQELFDTCRICGKKIININSFIVFKVATGEMYPIVPQFSIEL